MKRTISLLSILAFVLAFSGSAFAQDNTISASANVVTSISYDEEQKVNFGNIDPNLSPTPTLVPGNTQNNDGVNGPNVQVGYLVFSGTPEASVTINWNNPKLTETGGASVTFTPVVTTQTGDQSASASSGGGNAYTEGEMVSLGTSVENGQLTLLVGGSLSNPTSTPLTAGAYTGDVTFTIDYSY